MSQYADSPRRPRPAITLGAGWVRRRLTIYLLGAVAYELGKWALDALSISTQITPAVPLLG